MKFDTYDILSQLLPGILIMAVASYLFGFNSADINLLFLTAIAFVIGYLANTISSWLEEIYFLTWGGKPSTRLLSGKSCWKVGFSSHNKILKLLHEDAGMEEPKEDTLFSIALRNANDTSSNRISVFNTRYAFSRVMLTISLIVSVMFGIKYYHLIKFYLICLPVILICWERAKQRGYYYAREVLYVYLKQKEKK